MNPTIEVVIRRLACLAAILVLASFSAKATAADPPSPFQVVKPPQDRTPSRLLETFWPNHPEAVAEFVELVSGGQPVPDRGWYRKATSRSRLNWSTAREALDRDHDNAISLQEFGGSEADFRRLDRDQDHRLTSSDFEFPTNEQAMARSKLVFSFADRDGNGKLSREECDRMLFMAARDAMTRNRYFADALETVVNRIKESRREGLDYLSLADLQETIDRMAVVKNMPQPPDPNSDLLIAPTPILLRTFFRRELGAFSAGPEQDAPAPDFTLPTPDGRERITLSKRIGPRPVVLVFGNYSSPSFRTEIGSLEKLYARYRDRVSFLMVYVRDANPSDGWRLVVNDQRGIRYDQPRTDRERARVARMFQDRLDSSMPLVVDGVNDRVGSLYSGIPSRLYLVDRQGRIAYKGERGPFGFKPSELEHALLLLLRLP